MAVFDRTEQNLRKNGTKWQKMLPLTIELFVIRHYGVKPPHEVIPKQRQELLIDGFFSVMDARGQDILGVDILRGISR